MKVGYVYCFLRSTWERNGAFLSIMRVIAGTNGMPSLCIGWRVTGSNWQFLASLFLLSSCSVYGRLVTTSRGRGGCPASGGTRQSRIWRIWNNQVWLACALCIKGRCLTDGWSYHYMATKKLKNSFHNYNLHYDNKRFGLFFLGVRGVLSFLSSYIRLGTSTAIISVTLAWRRTLETNFRQFFEHTHFTQYELLMISTNRTLRLLMSWF